MTQEALKMALDALETELSIDWGNQDEFNASAEKMYEAIAAIKEALAQPEQWGASAVTHPEYVAEQKRKTEELRSMLTQPEQEPVAWGVDWGRAGDIACVSIIKRLPNGVIKVVAVEYAPYSYTHPPQRTEQEPVAWRTFDGEGGYDYRSYEDNESYADEWDKRNPNHKGWVDKLYTPPPPCPTCEALARTVMMDQTGRDA